MEIKNNSKKDNKEEEGIQKLRKILRVASINVLRIKWNKCQFFMNNNFTFLGNNCSH